MSRRSTPLRFEDEDENVGTESADWITSQAESGVRQINAAHRASRRREQRETEESKSHRQQKNALKREYAAARTGHGKEPASHTADIPEKVKRRTTQFISKHRTGLLLGWILTALVLLLVCVVSSCSVLIQGGLSAVTSSTYPSEDSALMSAEEQYCAMEAELQAYLDTYESTHAYDEYHYDLDEIGHDPYVLISAITALHGGEWTLDEVQDILAQLFEKQYILTETVTEEVRYRAELRTGYTQWVDPGTGAVHVLPYQYEVQVPYVHRVCTVELENFDLSHVPTYVMTEEQLSMYAMYMERLGNRPDLFSDSAYVDLYYNTEYEDYEIPVEALEDEQFAAMIAEAEKYLGMPYVFGGSKPETSFDCSGFVSWVLNHSGWDVGRLSAEGLRQICTRISPTDVKPGDLIFFEKTYNTSGASHVGIVVGEGMMIHAGDPIQYTSYNTSYWQSHFLQFGRLPTP